MESGRITRLFVSLLFAIALGWHPRCQAHDVQSCDSTQLLCPDPDIHQCIKITDLCNGVWDCANGEDEQSQWCENYNRDSECTTARGHTKCSRNCYVWKTACTRCGYGSQPGTSYNDGYRLNEDVCQAIQSGVLPSLPITTTEAPVTKPPIDISMEELATFMAVTNCSLEVTGDSSQCPMLYTPVGNSCVAFLPFPLTWPEAKQTCNSISGDLIELEDIENFGEMAQHLIESDFTSNFWTGGYFDIKSEAWMWITGSKMSLSTPYWMLRYHEECQLRPSSSYGNHTGCYHYVKAPSPVAVPGMCAALHFEHMFFISDQNCFDSKRPICLLKTLSLTRN